MSEKKVIREFKGKYFLLTDEEFERKADGVYKNTFWLECDKNGEIIGNLNNITLLCKIPDGHYDIDISTLADDCLYNGK